MKRDSNTTTTYTLFQKNTYTLEYDSIRCLPVLSVYMYSTIIHQVAICISLACILTNLLEK